MKMCRKIKTSKYTFYAVLAFCFCVIYNVYGNHHSTKSKSDVSVLSQQDINRQTITEAISDENIAVDFSYVGTVNPIEGIDELILERTSYIVSYNSETKCPNWVAWRLTREHTSGDVSRMGNAFHEDMEVPEPRANNSDYRKSGFSRGHMCPAGDNKWSKDAMYDTFLFSNICPQNGNLNSGVWNQIEMSCREWAKRYGDIYIICGPMFLKSHERHHIGESQVSVPDAFFKVILCLNQPKAIGFICRNNDGNKKKDMYVNTLNEVERLTGLHFFPLLDKEIRKLVDNQADINEW